MLPKYSTAVPFETDLSKSCHKCDVGLVLYEETAVITYLYILFSTQGKIRGNKCAIVSVCLVIGTKPSFATQISYHHSNTEKLPPVCCSVQDQPYEKVKWL